MSRVITVTIPTKKGETLDVSIATNRSPRVAEEKVILESIRDLEKAIAHLKEML